MVRLIEGLSRLAGLYDVLLCDVWGVIHNGREAFPVACDALSRWRTEQGPVILISNSPRPHPEVVAQLDALGIARATWTAIVTSGDATRTLLRERAPGPAWRIGPERDDPLYEGLGLAFADLDSARFIACTGPNDDETETPEDYRNVLVRAAGMDLEMVCANPDRVVQRGDRLIYCGGALAGLYEDLGGRVIMAGKPYAPIYGLALSMADEALGRPHGEGRVLAVGDGVSTDIEGAQRQGLDRLFIAGGIHGEESRKAGALSPETVTTLLARSGLEAQFAMGELTW